MMEFKNFEDFKVDQLRKIARYFNSHFVIPNINNLNKSDLIYELKKRLEIRKDGLLFLKNKSFEIPIEKKETKETKKSTITYPKVDVDLMDPKDQEKYLKIKSKYFDLVFKEDKLKKEIDNLRQEIDDNDYDDDDYDDKLIDKLKKNINELKKIKSEKPIILEKAKNDVQKIYKKYA